MAPAGPPTWALYVPGGRVSSRAASRPPAASGNAPTAAVAAATPADARPLTAGGWRDTTRIAAGDPDLWADILLDNAGDVAKALSRIAAVTEKILAALESGDRRRLVSLLKRAKEDRDAVGS